MDKAKENEKTRTIEEILLFCISLLLGVCEVKGGINLLPMCLLVAMGRPCFAVFAGGLITSVLMGDYIYTAVLMVAYGLLWLVVKSKKSVNTLVKTLISAVFTAGVYVFCYFDGNLMFEDISNSVIAFLLVPFWVASLSGVFEKNAKKTHRELGILAASLFAVKAVSVISFGSFNLAPTVATAVTMWLSGCGFVFGSVSGFVCGMGCGLTYMPMLGIMGFCYGMFFETSKFFASLFAFLLSSATHAYLIGVENIIPGTVMTLLGVLLFLIFEKRLPRVPVSVSMLPEKTVVTEAKLSAAFSSLSRVFFTVGQEDAKLKKTEISAAVCQNIGGVCNRCLGCTCDKADLSNKLTDILWEKHLVAYADLPSNIKTGCKMPNEIIMAANSVITNKKGQLNRNMTRLADEYLGFSRLICSANQNERRETQNDSQKSRRVRELLHDKKIRFKSVTVVGNRNIRLTVRGVEPSEIPLSAKEITYMLSTLLTTRLSEPEFIIGEHGTEMRLHSLPEVRVECAKVSVGKAGEAVCGDTVSFFESDDGYFYSLISDGMGSGRKAELASRLASLYLEKLLTLGADAGETLNLLNKMLISKDEEVFTTVDLLEIDKMTGSARMIKAGAAPTFVYRNGECFRLDACTAPVGIINEVRAAETKMKLKRGDYIVMTSDGITPTDPKPCLPKIGEKKSASALAAAIISAWNENPVSTDDMSVSVVRIA